MVSRAADFREIGPLGDIAYCNVSDHDVIVYPCSDDCMQTAAGIWQTAFSHKHFRCRTWNQTVGCPELTSGWVTYRSCIECFSVECHFAQTI